MTNKTTEQDMEAESVDTNDAAKTEFPEISKEISTETADEFSDEHNIQDAAGTRKNPEDADPELSEPLNSDHAQNTINNVSEAAENTHTDFTEAVEEVAPEEPEPVQEEPDYSIIAPGSLSRALKKCRDEADITVEDAAQEMRLPLAVVKALEAENFADLPDPPYVRGYLRSYARLNESDATNLINHYETLRGADPKDIASFTPVTPRYQPNNKKAVSPTTIKLAGFSMIVMLLVVLSMIPAVSQWASDTWQSFSEPQNQRLAAAASQQNAATGTENAETGTSEATDTTQNGSSTASSNSDTATPDNTEQLALNQDADGTNNTEATTEQNTDDGQTTETDTPAGDIEAADGTDATDTATGESSTADEKQQGEATDSDTDKTDPTATADAEGSDETDAAATKAAEEAAAAAKREAALAEAEAAKQKQEQEKAAAEKAAAEKAAADKLAAQQADSTQSDDNFKQPIDGSVIIRMVFTQDVWMSIKDGRGKTIFGALNAAGTRKEIKASTPLQFKVGNAPGVQIYLNGQLIDQKPYTRGSVATFRAN